ncbi:MAG TPA: hypothetical protein VLJ21_02495 [Candidatus Binatia bacterium]|nr:hypothetical protein [Candidatus Binatia bacterium]
MNKNIIIAIVLGILLVLSVVQAFQVNTIKEKLSSGGVKLATGAAPAGGGSVPSNLQNLPSMVGGC